MKEIQITQHEGKTRVYSQVLRMEQTFASAEEAERAISVKAEALISELRPLVKAPEPEKKAEKEAPAEEKAPQKGGGKRGSK